MPGIFLAAPGHTPLYLEHLVLDYNGTLAFHGRLLSGVAERLKVLAERVTVHVVSADTFGTLREELSVLEEELTKGTLVLEPLVTGETEREHEGDGDSAWTGPEAQAKLRLVRSLGPESCCAMGNGCNDQLMLGAAALSICVMGREGCAFAAMSQSMIGVADICDALDLLISPTSCIATLRC